MLSNFESTLAFAPFITYNLESINKPVCTLEENMVGEIVSAGALVVLVYFVFKDDSFIVNMIKRSR